MRQQHARLILRAHEDGHRGGRRDSEDPVADLSCNPRGFLGGVPEAAQQHARSVGLARVGGLGHERLAAPRERLRCGQHLRGQTEGFAHAKDLRVRPVHGEAQDVVAGGAAPAVDALIVVGGGKEARARAQLRLLARQPAQPLVLHRRRVLKLVDEDVGEARAVAPHHSRMQLKEAEDTEGEVGVIELAERAQPSLVLGVQHARRASHRVVTGHARTPSSGTWFGRRPDSFQHMMRWRTADALTSSSPHLAAAAPSRRPIPPAAEAAEAAEASAGEAVGDDADAMPAAAGMETPEDGAENLAEEPRVP